VDNVTSNQYAVFMGHLLGFNPLLGFCQQFSCQSQYIDNRLPARWMRAKSILSSGFFEAGQAAALTATRNTTIVALCGLSADFANDDVLHWLHTHDSESLVDTIHIPFNCIFAMPLGVGSVFPDCHLI
jgi:hypothetical protein